MNLAYAVAMTALIEELLPDLTQHRGRPPTEIHGAALRSTPVLLARRQRVLADLPIKRVVQKGDLLAG